MTNNQPKSIRLAAVGDLLLCSSPQSEENRGLEVLSGEILDLFDSCDLVFANLECTLPGEKSVPTEPLVLSTEQQIKTLADAGIDIVTLGNNHVFDCFTEGFGKISSLLNNMGIRWFGAGTNIKEAEAPAVVEINGVTLGFLAVVDNSTGPYRYADEASGGVVPLDADRICISIGELKERVDHVVVTPHWGMERFRIPSPQQVEQAHAFIDAGASMILGHHPHVVQGLEMYRGFPIAYSMGNFLANKVYWQDGRCLTWNAFERTGFILLVELDREKILRVEQVPVFDNGKTIVIQRADHGQESLDKVNKMLARGVTGHQYKKEKFIIQKMRPVLSHMRWSELKRVRPSHVGKLMKLLSG